MKFAWMALRNLSRNRRRTAISLAIVAAGAAALILTAGFVRFSFDGLREALIHGGLGHLEVVRAEAIAARGASALDRPLAFGLEDWRALAGEIERRPHVVATGPTLQMMGMVSKNGGEPVSFVGRGVEPERDRRMGFEVKLRSGAALADAAPEEGADTVLLAQGLARSLGVGVGDTVTLLAVDPDGMLNALDARVAGIVTTGVADLDTRYLKTHLATAQRLLQTERTSDLLVVLDSTDASEAVAADLARQFDRREPQQPRLAVVGWRERAAFFDQVRNLYLGIFWFLGTIVFVLVVLATSNTLVMTVLERMRELGTLRAIGTGRAQLAALLLAEALWLGLLGGALGAAAGWLLTWAINAAQLKMPPPPGAVSPIDLQLAYVPAAFGGAIALMGIVLAVAAIGPIVKATRLRIVEALGHV